MPVPLILCRLKDDHSVTKMIGETALVYFPDWERVPEQVEEDEPKAKPSPVKVTTSRTGKAATSAESKE